MTGCATGIAFAGKSSLYKIDCKTGLVHRFIIDPFNVGTWSGSYQNQKASGLAGDKADNLWIHDNKNIFGWESNKWQTNELPGKKTIPKQIAAGESEHVYAVTTTNEIFRFATFDWIKIPKVRASTIAVGKNGRIFITYANGKILRSIWDGES